MVAPSLIAAGLKRPADRSPQADARCRPQVREFVLQRIYQLKRPKTNIQIIQQSSLLKYKYFVRFLRAHGKEAYAEIRAEYIATLSKILAAHFRTYLASMREMQTVGCIGSSAWRSKSCSPQGRRPAFELCSQGVGIRAHAVSAQWSCTTGSTVLL